MASTWLVGALFVLQLVYEAQRVISAPAHTPGGQWAWYATYAFIGALFFGVGALIWLYTYTRQRAVAALLFGFCTLVMCAFGTLSGDAVGDNLSNALGSSASACAVLCLFLLLLRFPRNLLPQRKSLRRAVDLLQGAIAALCLLSVSSSLLNDDLGWTTPRWWYLLGGFYYGIVGLLTVLIVAFAARRATSIRALQQTRLFFAGTLLSFVPILLLTVIPQLLRLSVSIDGTRSMVFLVCFPIGVAYSLLRYDLLLTDVFIRKIVTWFTGAVGIALLGYLLFAASAQLLGGSSPLLLACLVGAGVLSSPFVWWQARRLTDRFFFPEAAYYASRIKQAHAHHGLETFDLQLASHRLALDISTTLLAPQSRIFVLDEEAQLYRLIPLPQREARGEQANRGLPDELAALLSPNAGEGAPTIAAKGPAISFLEASPRPLFLSEMLGGERRGAGLARYLKSRPRGAAPDPLLAAIKTPEGKLIGLVAVAERGDRQLYAGPELEALQLLNEGAASSIETARLFEMATRQQEASRRELEQAYEQQRQLSEQKDQFIIHVSHELRTPLSEVSGYLDMLATSGSELDPELCALFIQKAQHGSEELMKLVESILDAAQSSFASPLPLHIEEVRLSSTVREALEHLDPQGTRNHPIELQVAESTQAFADAHALQLILQNLLSNALKYTPAGTPIVVRAQVDQEQTVCVQVKDEGPGIPPEEAPLLFGKFARLQRDTSGTIRGTGLGLYISKQLIEAMGGRIWLESSGVEGEGSIFAFTLPQADAPQVAARSAEGMLV